MVSCFDNIFETENPTHRPILEVMDEMGLTKKNSNTRVKSTVEMIRRASTPVEQDNIPTAAQTEKMRKNLFTSSMTYSAI